MGHTKIKQAPSTSITWMRAITTRSNPFNRPNAVARGNRRSLIAGASCGWAIGRNGLFVKHWVNPFSKGGIPGYQSRGPVH